MVDHNYYYLLFVVIFYEEIKSNGKRWLYFCQLYILHGVHILLYFAFDYLITITLSLTPNPIPTPFCFLLRIFSTIFIIYLLLFIICQILYFIGHRSNIKLKMKQKKKDIYAD